MTTIYYTSILAGLKFKKGSCLKLSVSFLSYLNLCFALTENKVAVTEDWMRRRAHFTGVRKRKHINYWIIQIYYVQSSSGVVVKRGLLSEWHSSLYNKASIKQKSNKEKKFPHHPPHPLPHLCFSAPNPPFPSPIYTLLEPFFYLYMQRKQSGNCSALESRFFETTLHGKASLVLDYSSYRHFEDRG